MCSQIFTVRHLSLKYVYTRMLSSFSPVSYRQIEPQGEPFKGKKPCNGPCNTIPDLRGRESESLVSAFLDLANTGGLGNVGRGGGGGGDVLALEVGQEAGVGAGVGAGAAVGVEHAVAAEDGLAGGVAVGVGGGEHLAALGRGVDDIDDVLEGVTLEEDVGTSGGLEGLRGKTMLVTWYV